MLNRRDALTSIVGLPLFSQVKENNSKLPDDEVKAKAEMWDLFMSVCQKAFDKVDKIGPGVPILNPSRRIGSNKCHIYLGDEYFESENLEEVYIKGLIHRLEELSKGVA